MRRADLWRRGLRRSLRRIGAGLTLAALLAACAPEPGPDPMGALPLRNPTVPLGGTARFDPARFAGDWHSRACLGTCPAQLRFAQGTDGTLIRNSGESRSAYRPQGTGILRPVATGGDTLVVMWVDEGFRTAVIGTASGSRAAILDRSRTGGADRIAAATEILDFYGWDTRRLQGN